MTPNRAGERLRGPEDPQRATFLELFFDLAFVFALFQLSHGLIEHLRWSGAFQTLVLLSAVWWVWITTTWITDRLSQQWPPVQLMVIVTLLGSVVVSAAVPGAFGPDGLVFAGVYVAIQMYRGFFLVFAMRGLELEPIALRALSWYVVSAVPWIAGGLTHGTVRAGLWALAVAIDYLSYVFGFPVPGHGRASQWEPPAAAEHLAERYRQIFIIALGELILVSGLALGRGGFAPGRIGALVVSIAGTSLLWRIYIHRAAEVLSRAIAVVHPSPRIGAAAGYSHIAMIAGVVVTAVGDELVIAHPLHRTPPAWSVVFLGGPALFLAGRAAFEYSVFARVSWDRPIGVLALVALVPVTLVVPALPASAAATAVLVGVAIADAARTRGRPPEPPMPAGPGRR